MFILKKFFFFICQFVFHRVHDLFKEIIISYFAKVIIIDKESSFTVECCIRDYHVFNRSGKLSLVQS